MYYVLFGVYAIWLLVLLGRQEKQESQEMLTNSPISEWNPSVRDTQTNCLQKVPLRVTSQNNHMKLRGVSKGLFDVWKGAMGRNIDETNG